MIEETVLNYMKTKMNVPCYMEIPADPPDSFIVIEKTGSSELNYIEEATITVQSYAETLFKAASLNEDVKSAMKDIIATEDIAKAQLNADYNYTDTSLKRYRYQAVFDLVF